MYESRVQKFPPFRRRRRRFDDSLSPTHFCLHKRHFSFVLLSEMKEREGEREKREREGGGEREKEEPRPHVCVWLHMAEFLTSLPL